MANWFFSWIEFYKRMLMEDGALVHSSKIYKEWKQTCLLEKLKWLANSLNLNHVENLLRKLKDVVQHGKECPKNLNALKELLKESGS